MTVTAFDEICKDVCPYHYFWFSLKLIMDTFNVIFVSMSNTRIFIISEFFVHLYCFDMKTTVCLLKSPSTGKNKAD